MKILLIVNKFPIEGEPKQGKYPAIFKGLIERGHSVIMLAHNADIRSKGFGSFSTTELFPNKSVLIQLFIGRMVFKSLSRVLHRLVKSPIIRKLTGDLTVIYSVQILKRFFNKNGAPDIIHVYGSQSLTAPKIAVEINKYFSVPFVWNIHSHKIFEWEIESSNYHEKYIPYFKKCEYFLPVSQPLGDKWVQMAGENIVGPILDIPNPVDPLIFKVSNSKVKITGLSLIHVSTLSQNKNIDLMIKAFYAAFTNVNEGQLLLIGNDSLTKDAQILYNDSRNNGRVHLLGRQSRNQIATLMQEVDCYIQSSIFETFGIPVVEALMSGLPVIVTKSGGPESFITSDNGIVVQGSSIQSLSDAIKLMGKTISEYDPNSIRESAISKFSLEPILDKMEYCYSKVLEKNKI